MQYHHSLRILLLTLWSLSLYATEEDARQKSCQAVYKQLKNALPFCEEPPPALIFNGNKPHYNTEKNIICMPSSELKWYAQYDPKQVQKYMAVVLAHELGHWYDKYAPEENKRQFFRFLGRDDDEARADFFGEFLCYLALKNSQRLNKEAKIGFLKAHYKRRYAGNHQISNIVNIRIETYKEARKQLTSIQKNLEKTRFLTMFKYRTRYLLRAIELYQEVIPSYPSAELYNNIGACYLRIAMQKYYYVLPVEIDPCKRITDVTRIGTEVCKAALDSAFQNLRKAHKLNSNYEKVQVHLACAHLLQQAYDQTSKITQHLFKSSSKSIQHDCYVIEAISKHQQNKQEEARRQLLEAEECLPNSLYVRMNNHQFNSSNTNISKPQLFECKLPELLSNKKVSDLAINYMGGHHTLCTTSSRGFTIKLFSIDIPANLQGSSIKQIKNYKKTWAMPFDSCTYYVFTNVILITKDNKITNWIPYYQ